VRNWLQVLNKFAAEPHYYESDMNTRVLSAGENMTIFTPQDADNHSFAFDRSNPAWVKLNEERLHVSVEICYCSTLGECWTLRAGGNTASSTTGCRRCPSRSEVSFEQ
jgi:hypothetical protein